MGIDIGFDMVPRLSPGGDAQQLWNLFIGVIKERYKDDARVELETRCIVFKVGEYPMLPYDGHKFLRFSSKMCGGVREYIVAVTGIARGFFGTRVQPWSEACDQFGHYDWGEVHKSIDSYEQPDEPRATTISAESTSTEPPIEPGIQLFEVQHIRDKGKGLIAKFDIPEGTQILCEKPLFTVRPMPPNELDATVSKTLKALSKTQQRQFLSLHNNFPGKHVFRGIVKTNALPCGPGSSVGGVYPTICLINHSCLPNSHNNWNDEAKHETIHAIRLIKAGEEITIPYDHGGPSAVRRASLKNSFGFDCMCSGCTLPPSELQASDIRRQRIKDLDDSIGDPYCMASNPEKSLRNCRSLLHTLNEEFDGHAGALLARVYYDAFQICVAHGDSARACAFAQRAYDARMICEGADSPATQRMKSLSLKPTNHASFGAYSMKWKTREGLEFNEAKLFRQ